MNALKQLSTLPERKEQIKSFAAAGIKEVKSGNYNAGVLKMRAKFIIDSLQLILKDKTVNQLVINELSKYIGQEFMGARIERLGNKKTYDYSKCNDKKWNDAIKIVKEREAFLRALPAQMADPETGDIINPPTYTSSEFLVIK